MNGVRPGVSAPPSPPTVRSSLHMGAVLLLVGLLLGIVIGAAIGYLFARGRLAAAAAAADERARSADERSKLVESQLAERFQALSAQALDASTARFLDVAEGRLQAANATAAGELEVRRAAVEQLIEPMLQTDRKSTRLNSSHMSISYAVFCLKKNIPILTYLQPSASTAVWNLAMLID